MQPFGVRFKGTTQGHPPFFFWGGVLEKKCERRKPLASLLIPIDSFDSLRFPLISQASDPMERWHRPGEDLAMSQIPIGVLREVHRTGSVILRALVRQLNVDSVSINPSLFI